MQRVLYKQVVMPAVIAKLGLDRGNKKNGTEHPLTSVKICFPSQEMADPWRQESPRKKRNVLICWNPSLVVFLPCIITRKSKSLLTAEGRAVPNHAFEFDLLRFFIYERSESVLPNYAVEFYLLTLRGEKEGTLCVALRIGK